jgi:hypothetical protein
MTLETSKTVFVLQHERIKDADNEDVKFIGVYSTIELGQAAVSRLLQQPGFAEHPHGFHLTPYELDRDHWVEGFGVPHETDV